MRDEIEDWKRTVQFWQNRHDNFLKQVKVISTDMERLKAENDALIFVNKELGNINDNLRIEIETCRSQNPREDDDNNISDDTRPVKKTKTTPKQKSKNKNTAHESADDEAARVCKIRLFYNALTNFFNEFTNSFYNRMK